MSNDPMRIPNLKIHNCNDPMRIVNLTIHNCSSIQITPDPENGCIDIYCFDDEQRAWTKFQLLVFGPGNDMPGLDLREPLKPELEDADEH